MKKSKLVESTPWKGDADKFGNLKYNVKFENGDEGVQTATKGNEFIVGEEYEYELTPTKWSTGKEYNKITRPKKDFSGKGGFKKEPIMQKFNETLGMVRSNAIHAMNVVNDAYEKKVINFNDLSVIEKFTLGGISGDIEKFGEESNALTGRLAAVNNSVLATKVEQHKSGADIVALAEKYFQYTTKI